MLLVQVKQVFQQTIMHGGFIQYWHNIHDKFDTLQTLTNINIVRFITQQEVRIANNNITAK